MGIKCETGEMIQQEMLIHIMNTECAVPQEGESAASLCAL